jgi:predicted nucleotidyltransferase
MSNMPTLDPDTLAAIAPSDVDIDHRLELLLSRIVPALHPEAVYLLGSRARGTAHQDSDYDLLVVVPDTTLPDHVNPVAGYAVIRGLGIPADIIPCHRTGFDRAKDRVGTLCYEATHYGRLVYGR